MPTNGVSYFLRWSLPQPGRFLDERPRKPHQRNAAADHLLHRQHSRLTKFPTFFLSIMATNPFILLFLFFLILTKDDTRRVGKGF